MLIAITANGEDLDSPVECSFEKCQNFIFYDTEIREIVDVVDNPAIEILEGGSLEAGEEVVGHDVEALLTGDIDPDAGDVLGRGGIEVYLCTEGTVESAIEQFLTGDLELRPGPSRGTYPGPGSPETPHSREPSPGSDPGREETDAEVVGVEVECVCPVCGEVVPQEGPEGAECETMECPRCGSSMIRHLKVE